MYIAMNQFRVHAERCDDFERAWRERDSFLAGTPGFREFHLLRGADEAEGIATYASHTVWESEAAFSAWMASDAFRKAHAQGKLTGIIAGPPRFAGWTAVDLGR
jgi:heme-degrading monooxygenase HmoA